MSPKRSENLVNVAVISAIRRPLTYRVPPGLDLRTGQRVTVPLGRRPAPGIVLEPVTRVAPGIALRDVIRAVDSEPALSPELLTLGLWIADYYLAPPGEALRAMLPLRSESRRARTASLGEPGRRRLEELSSSLLEEARESVEAKLLRYVVDRKRVSLETLREKFGGAPAEILEAALRAGFIAIEESRRATGRREVFAVRVAQQSAGGAKLSPVARKIVDYLEKQGPVEDHRALLKSAGGSLARLKKLRESGWIELAEPAASPPGEGESSQPPVELTPAQTRTLDELEARLGRTGFSVALLHGVTASGKTEIYLRLIARCLERGRTALALVPEIGLTPAIQSLFIERFGNRVAVLHSGLGENERHDAWWRIRRGEAPVVLGTRSAVFAPIERPGLIVVDEEHDASYKQEDTPRYNGRDVAVVRGRIEKALVVLGSATPSLESYANARSGKYTLCELPERVAGRPLATVEIVDMREEFRETHTQVPISRRLREAIEAQREAGGQTMILLNRRGYAWFLLCRSCGEAVRCVNCSISLTYHRREHRLLCHYCGYSAPVPSHCPACGSEYLYYVGEGTEKLETKLAEAFPKARVARLDRDTVHRAGQYRKILSAFREGKIDILVGTQLIAKGHDFPGVTLVGIVSADTALSLPDFRSAERTFQLLTQAAGRAGRGEAPGRVLVQTFYPEHYAIRLAAEQNYAGFFAKEMQFRRLMHYPPAVALANIVARDEKLERAARTAEIVSGIFGELADPHLKVIGPSPAPLARIEGRYRIQFLVKADSRERLKTALNRALDECEQQGIPPRSLIVDMDPLSLM